ncbi:hypothetical protein EZV62_016818 [Acer yangbiense]|uniref:GPI ethanolamine phosphate transferase 1 n=1 Tax=Acer yangbiense TaxID=1000413 RepID=A0A5C7HQ83_9ROSI|nr:hypothetical protein EZV62_016818 [Acer yangbiense]
MRVDGILGTRETSTSTISRIKWLKRREMVLVVLGVVLHAVYMLSIFDIYFKTPIVHGMDPVPPRFVGPAKRLVLLVADGLRADKFYEPDSKGNYRAPFLRSVIKNQGRWGVSHARPPTESRPGHVALIAGFYEDPSAVTKGWKANPVEFDSVFNQSRHTISFGSPDIVPIFCGALPHSTWNTYPHEFEDFATDASFLDEWSFDQLQSLFNRSNQDTKIKELLLQDNLVIFLHLLGCDSNGHAHRPFSSIYLNNVKVVDHIAERVYSLLEGYYKDNRTAYIFTADHGMSDKGSHGDGHPTNTDTPLVVWGAGVRYPKPVSNTNHSDHVFRFVDEHAHDMPTPAEWGLDGIERVDVNQADITPLMVALSSLLGLPCPVNSVGNLPLEYINMNEAGDADKVEAVLANTKQILNQFLQKSHRIENLISVRDYEAALKLSENLRSLALQGLHYFQTYDWLMLMSVITLGYIGWMVCLVLHVLRSYTSLPGHILKMEPAFSHRNNSGKVMSKYTYVDVHSFTKRELYTWCFLITGVVACFYLFNTIPRRSGIPIFVFVACCFLSVFTLMPAEIPDNNQLVIMSGAMIIIIGASARWLDLHSERNKYWLSICCHELKKPRFPMLFHLQALLVGLASVMVSVSTSHRTENKELHGVHQLINWSIAGFSLVLPLFSENGLLSRLTSIFLGCAPAFLLLSIGYEAVFYGALALVLVSWILFENSLLHSSTDKKSSLHMRNKEEHNLENDSRDLQLSDVRIPLVFMVLFNVAFFGTGNFASIASFEISSVYRFITVFSPFLMAALLIFKLFIPFVLVICAFSAITKLLRLPRLGLYFLVILLSDVMTIHFFFLVRNKGSWMEIGNSISHFGIMSAQVVFVLLLLAVTNIYTKDIQIRSTSPSSRKASYTLYFKLFELNPVIELSSPGPQPLFGVLGRFGGGLELANLVVSSGLLSQSWDSILELYRELNPSEQIRFGTYHGPNCTVIAFVTSPTLTKHHLQEEDELVSSSFLPPFHFLCTKSNPTFSIHKAAVTLFSSLIDQLTNLKNQISNSVPLIVTGHSVGGSVASLFTLWLLESMNLVDAKRVLCITFGAPLIGDEGLQQAISSNSKWNSCFLHVAANQDLVPRLFVSLSPHNPNAMQVDSGSVAYQPFGTYLLCSESGYTCIEDSEEVFQLLVTETPRNQNPNVELEIFYYTETVKLVEDIVIYQGISKLGEAEVHPLRARTILQLDAIGVKRTQQACSVFNTLITNMERREMFRVLKRKDFDPDKKLNDMKVHMAYLEWYKKTSMSEKEGYYDSYKNNRLQKDMDVKKYKKRLNYYWKKVVEEAERMPQRENAPLNRRWLYGGTNYRRMVEPLDIADYYSKGLKNYKAYGRSEHYKKLEEWLEVDAPKSKPDNGKKLNVSNSLTEDSCFWERVEEALILCKSLRNGEGDGELTRRNLVMFEEYVMEQIKNYAVSPDIFLEGSSFMRWWIEYESIIGTFYISELTDLMKTGKYKKYADGSLDFLAVS